MINKMDSLKWVPDFFLNSIDDLPLVLNGNRVGYAAEEYANSSREGKIVSYIRHKKPIELDDQNKKEVYIFFGGRYYSIDNENIEDNYIGYDPLSFLILKFKSQHVAAIDEFYDDTIMRICKNKEIDIITSIPQKPSDIIRQRFDRFGSLGLPRNTAENRHLQTILNCIKDFSQRGQTAEMREAAVKNSFVMAPNVDIWGKDILLIDDVYTTGATVLEAAKVLYKNGAKSVTILVLAVNQLIVSASKFHPLICQRCQKAMKLRMNRQTQELFYSCDNFRECKKSLSLKDGQKQVKKLNSSYEMTTSDLEHEY